MLYEVRIKNVNNYVTALALAGFLSDSGRRIHLVAEYAADHSDCLDVMDSLIVAQDVFQKTASKRVYSPWSHVAMIFDCYTTLQ